MTLQDGGGERGRPAAGRAEGGHPGQGAGHGDRPGRPEPTVTKGFAIHQIFALKVGVARIVPNEEESAAERCSEKLVDLVVLLTTKLDNNVEDLRKELTDNINENIERFEKVQQQQEVREGC